MFLPIIIVAALAAMQIATAQEHRISPTWLHRNLATAQEWKSDISTPTCHYKPLFGEGDADPSAIAGIARYGEAVLDPHGTCSGVQLSREDEILVVLQGNGTASYEAQK